MTEAEIEGVAITVLRAAGSRLDHYTPANLLVCRNPSLRAPST